MDAKSEKRVLRRTVVDRILDLAPEAREAQDASLRTACQTLPGLPEAYSVLLYASCFPEEIDVRPLWQAVVESGKRLILPRVNRVDRRLELCEIHDPDRDLAIGRMGIAEPMADRPRVPPIEIDWVLVPGIAFDSTGARLGRGGGYYDRLLPELPSETPRWALLYDQQWVERVPIEPHDCRLSGLISPSRRWMSGQ